MSKEVVQVNKKVFTVKYNNHDCKKAVLLSLNAYPGISAQNDTLNSGKLLRDVTVILKGSTDFGIPRAMLQGVGSIRYEKAVFTVKLRDSTRQRALAEVRALKDVVAAKFDRVDNTLSACGSSVPSTLNVFGKANPRTVLGLLRNYGTAGFA